MSESITRRAALRGALAGAASLAMGRAAFAQQMQKYLPSGIGAKAGGPDYVLQFTESRVVTENTMRQGIPVD